MPFVQLQRKFHAKSAKPLYYTVYAKGAKTWMPDFDNYTLLMKFIFDT